MRNTFISLSALSIFAALLVVNPCTSYGQQSGSIAPPLHVPSNNGELKQINLTSNNELVLLHFWASWCPNSLIQLPHLKSLYDKYQFANFTDDSRFKIVSISIDEQQSEWQRAITDYQLSWSDHYRDTYGYDSWALYNYQVNQVPNIFLIDSKGFIVGRNMTFSQLDRYLTNEQTISYADYEVELGIFPTLKFHKFDHINHLGNLVTESTPDNQYRITFGTFSEEQEALVVWDKLMKQGYYEAKVITIEKEPMMAYNDGSFTPPTIIRYEDTPPTPPSYAYNPPDVLQKTDAAKPYTSDYATDTYKAPDVVYSIPKAPANTQTYDDSVSPYDYPGNGNQTVFKTYDDQPYNSPNPDASQPDDVTATYQFEQTSYGEHTSQSKSLIDQNAEVFEPSLQPITYTNQEHADIEEMLASMEPTDKKSRRVKRKMERAQRKASKLNRRASKYMEAEADLLERYKFMIMYSGGGM